MEEKTSIFTRPVNELSKENMKKYKSLIVEETGPLAEFLDDITEEELQEMIEELQKENKENEM